MAKYFLVKRGSEGGSQMLMLILAMAVAYLVYTQVICKRKVKVGVISETEEHFTQPLKQRLEQSQNAN